VKLVTFKLSRGELIHFKGFWIARVCKVKPQRGLPSLYNINIVFSVTKTLYVVRLKVSIDAQGLEVINYK
jgi:hypothetical protein